MAKTRKGRKLHFITFDNSEHYQNARIGDIRVDAEPIIGYSRLVRPEKSKSGHQLDDAVKHAPCFAQAFSAVYREDIQAILGDKSPKCLWVEYFAINEVLGMRAGWWKLEEMFGPADITNLGEKGRRALKCYESRGYISFRRMGDGVNIYVATPEQVRQILGER